MIPHGDNGGPELNAVPTTFISSGFGANFPMGFLSSSGLFLWRVAKRSVAAALLLAARETELYAKIRKTELYPKITALVPQEWWSTAETLLTRFPNWDLYCAAAIVALAVLYTHYEVERQLTRDPKVLKKLKALYAQSGEMLSRTVTTDKELEKLVSDADTFRSVAQNWIGGRMDRASLTRFNDSRMRLPYHHPSPKDEAHQQLLNTISRYHDNLQVMISSEYWR